MSKDIPRRIRIDLMTPAELAIREAMLAVEALPADPRLTAAVNLLSEARERVADYVDAALERAACAGCKETGMHPSHNGSRLCESGSIASGGTRAHCTCDVCF